MAAVAVLQPIGVSVNSIRGARKWYHGWITRYNGYFSFQALWCQIIFAFLGRPPNITGCEVGWLEYTQAERLLKRHTGAVLVLTEYEGSLQTYWNKQVWHLPLILLPILAIFAFTPLNVPQRSVSNHHSEEQGIEPRKGTLKASDETPCQGKIKVACVVDLPCVPI